MAPPMVSIDLTHTWSRTQPSLVVLRLFCCVRRREAAGRETTHLVVAQLDFALRRALGFFRTLPARGGQEPRALAPRDEREHGALYDPRIPPSRAMQSARASRQT